MNDKLPWYHEGVRFKCRGCGNCCGGSPGITNITEDEINRAAPCLGMEPHEFKAVYTWQSGYKQDDISLREKKNYDCVFYKTETGCEIYDNRPEQCRTWPFWERVLDSSYTWEQEARNCPGMNSGNLYTAKDIESILKSKKPAF